VDHHAQPREPAAGPRAKADEAAHFPTLDDGIAGVAFIEAVEASSARGEPWVKLPALGAARASRPEAGGRAGRQRADCQFRRWHPLPEGDHSSAPVDL